MGGIRLRICAGIGSRNKETEQTGWRVQMKRIVIDLDGTLTLDDSTKTYAEKAPRADVVARLREYRAAGYEIVVHTARNMRTYSGNVEQVTLFTLPTIIEWLRAHDIPYDDVVVGKPWCGYEGFYVDDRAIRPGEFVDLSRSQIADLLVEPKRRNAT